MSWSKTQNQMIHELNESVFSRDPINRIYDPMCPIDVQNTNYVMELKNREKYNPEDFDGLVERMESNGFMVEYLNEKPDLFQYLI